MYGFEYLLKEVAMNYNTKIHVSAERLAMYKYLPDMSPYFTSDGRSTRIHACKWETKRHCESDLPCGLSVHPSLKMKVLRIKPTTMWVARDSEPMPADYKRYDKEKRLWRVVHSMHASMEEIQDLVGYLRPYHVFPNVPPAGLDSLEDAFERLKGLTRLQECDSCNQDESAEDYFKEQGERRYVAEEKKQERKTVPIKLLPVIRPAPDEKVLAQCKELGIAEEENLAPVPKRRKSKASSIVLEEKPSTELQEPADISTPKQLEQPQGYIPHMGCHEIPIGELHDGASNRCNSDSAAREDSGEKDSQLEKSTTSTSGAQEAHNTSLAGRLETPVSLLRDDRSKDPQEDFTAVKGREEERHQSHRTTASTPRGEVRALDENNVVSKVTNGQLNKTLQSKAKCSQNSIEGVMEEQGNDFPEKSGDYFTDRNTCQSKAIDTVTECTWENEEGMSKQRSTPLTESNFGLKTTATKCFASAERSSASEKFYPGGMGGELLGNKLDFDVPPSPGHVEPCQEKMSQIYQKIQNGGQLSITELLKF